MALATGTLTFNLADLLGQDFDARRTKVWLTTNISDDTLIDTDANQVRLGSGRVSLGPDGTGTAVVWLPGPDGNPVSWQTYLHVDYADTGTRQRSVRTFGPYTITASVDLVDLVLQQEIPPEYLNAVTTELDEKVAAAAASAALAHDLSNIDDTDDAVDFLLTHPSQTKTTLDGRLAEKAEAEHTHTADEVTDFTAAATQVATDVVNDLAPDQYPFLLMGVY